MRLALIGTAAAALTLAFPAIATADKTVQAGVPSGCNPQGQCSSIQAANDAAGNNETIFVMPGDWPGANLTRDNLKLVGQGNGQARITSALNAGGNGTLTLQRLVIRSSGSALTIPSAVLDKTIQIQSCILSGSGNSAAVAATGGVLTSSITINARHVTIADAGDAPATSAASNSGPVSATFRYSIVKGATPGFIPDATNDTSSSYDRLFVDRGSEDFRLRADSVAVDQGAGAESSETSFDVDGESRGPTWDRGADEFINDPPSQAVIAAFKSNPETGESVGFSASGATDPDADLQDAVVAYVWDFGDGTVETKPVGNPNFNAHTYTASGQYQARARGVDRTGAQGPWSNPVTITVTDPPPPPPPPPGGNTVTIGPGGAGLPGISAAGAQPAGPDTTPPFLAITFPAHNQRVKLGRTPPVLRGRNADDSGVRRVELALARREGTRCRWYDGRGGFRLGACTALRWFKATIDDFDWRFAFPRTVRPVPGTYALFVRGADYLGNAATTLSVPAKTATVFRVVR
jgi:hypothetical protein